VVVGTAITDPLEITSWFVSNLPDEFENQLERE